jgi:hypothetical protein
LRARAAQNVGFFKCVFLMEALDPVLLVGSVEHVLHASLSGVHELALPPSATDEHRDILHRAADAREELTLAEAAIAEKRAAMAAEDARLYAAARAMHMQPVEYGEDGAAQGGGGGGGGSAPYRGPRGVPVVSGEAVMRSVEEQRLVRTGNLRLGTEPPDFSASAGEPHYLAGTRSAGARVEKQAERMLATVGGWGATFHATGTLSAAELPPHAPNLAPRSAPITSSG